MYTKGFFSPPHIFPLTLRQSFTLSFRFDLTSETQSTTEWIPLNFFINGSVIKMKLDLCVKLRCMVNKGMVGVKLEEGICKRWGWKTSPSVVSIVEMGVY